MPKTDFIHNYPIFIYFLEKQKFESIGDVPFFVSVNYQSFTGRLIFMSVFSKKYLSLNFHQIFPDDDLSVEMSSGSFDPYLICK
jgi:hypothetical protein